MRVEAVARRLDEPVVAAARFRTRRPAMGSGDWIATVLTPVSLVMARRDEGLPRNVVLAVTTGHVYLFASTGRAAGAWGRAHVEAWADRSGDEWEVWINPPGDRSGFGLRGRQSPATNAVVDALGARP